MFHHFPSIFPNFSHIFPTVSPFSGWTTSLLGRQKLLQTQRAALSGGGSGVTVATSEAADPQILVQQCREKVGIHLISPEIWILHDFTMVLPGKFGSSPEKIW